MICILSYWNVVMHCWRSLPFVEQF